MRSSELPSIPMDPEDKARRLERFIGNVASDDTEIINYWRDRSPAEHAEAGAEMSDMAARIAIQTGLGKDPNEVFPGFSSFERHHSKV